MTYREKFVGVVKVKGKILREHGDIVTIPFGEEYSIFLKNLNTQKAVVNVSIDGTDVLDNHRLIISPNQNIELEGFLNGTYVSNKFKFIQKTKEIQDYRGDKIDDGIIRIEYRFEKPVVKLNYIVEKFYTEYPSYNYYNNNSNSFLGGTRGLNNISNNISCSIGNESLSDVSVFTCSAAPTSDEGITVKGSNSSQNFRYGNVGELEDISNVIILKLRGVDSSGAKILEAIQVDKKIICETCGRSSKSSDKFCRNCGTSLI